MTKLGRNVTNKYGQKFSQVLFLYRLYSSTSINNLLNYIKMHLNISLTLFYQLSLLILKCKNFGHMLDKQNDK